MRLDKTFDLFQFYPGKGVIPRQFQLRLQPELRLPMTAVHVNVHARFLTGEKEEPVAPLPEYGGAHRFFGFNLWLMALF
jgi:hypothetical protein